MNRVSWILVAGVLAVAAVSISSSEKPLKIGLIMTYSGPYASYGHQADLGVETYIKAFGDTIGGRKIEIIRKDDTGVAPDVSKRVTEELVIQDKVDAILGGNWSPNV